MVWLAFVDVVFSFALLSLCKVFAHLALILLVEVALDARVDFVANISGEEGDSKRDEKFAEFFTYNRYLLDITSLSRWDAWGDITRLCF